MLAGIEAGGTTITCAVGPSPREIHRRTTIPTIDPATTLTAITAFLRAAPADEPPITTIGIASFGPLDLDPASPTYGSIQRTPKPGWSHINLRAAIAEAMHCKVAIDTDVNASGIAEATHGAGAGLPSLAYITVGTGIGGALIQNGRPLHGLTHPEMGHIRPRRHADDPTFPGICPFHQDCIEGLASGAAIIARTGTPLSDHPVNSPIFAIIADYLAQLCATLMLISAPHRIVLGGGVMASNPVLFPLIRQSTQHWLADYIQAEPIAAGIAEFIVPPALKSQSGIIGALMLAANPASHLDAGLALPP